MTEQEQMLNTREAAEYLGMDVRAFREHLYKQMDVAKDSQERGKNLYTKQTLDKFRAVKRPRGRPRTKGESGDRSSQPATTQLQR